jgi:hypothetical protein
MAANTIPTLSYANTFGDWVVATNFLINQNNQASTNSFTKATGTYYFNDPSLGLSVANNAIIGGGLQVVGTGSYATIQNGLTAGQGTFSNTGTSLTVIGQSQFGNTIFANGTTGLLVSNSATVGTNFTVGGATYLNTLQVANGASFLGTTTFNGSLIVGGVTAYNNGTGQWNISITGSAGNAATVTNGIYSNLYYSDPTWLTGLSTTKLIGTVNTSQILAGSVVFSVTGTANQIVANNNTGPIQLSLPQNIHVGATPTFAGLYNTGNYSNSFTQLATSYVYPGYQSGQGTGVNASYYLGGSSTYGLYTNSGLYATGTIYSTQNIVAYFSDKRLKKVINNIPNALSKVQSLNGFVYVENDKAKELGFNNTKQQVGVSAQEVQNVMPEAVSMAPFDMDENKQSKSGENYLTVDYARLVPLLVEAIKELKAEVDNLKK